MFHNPFKEKYQILKKKKISQKHKNGLGKMCETKIRFLRFPDGRQSLSGPRTHHRCLALFTKQTIIFIACNMVVSRQRRKPLSFPLEKAWKRTVECNKGTAEAS